MTESKSKSKTKVEIQKIAPGPEDDDLKFQTYCNDERLGFPPLVHKPLEFAKQIGPSKTVFDSLKNELKDAFEALEDVSEKELEKLFNAKKD